MTFRDREKERYRSVKPKLFSVEAQPNGLYRLRPRDFCLADECSNENLYGGIRASAIQYFSDRRIPWHDGLKSRTVPSNHLCCSQSCCINFLYPLVSNPDFVKTVLGNFYPNITEPLAITGDLPLPDKTFPFMAFEWIGTKDFLGESSRKGGRRTRGANATSADFAFRFRRNDGKIQLVLGEWKYTESYGRSDLGEQKPVRKENYRQAFHRVNGVFGPRFERLYDTFFFDPFYQLMRLQLLAQEMESGNLGREMEADLVSVLHVCPMANGEFREPRHVTSPGLKQEFPGKGTLEIWNELVPDDKFLSISVENLLDTISTNKGRLDSDWVNYLECRYDW